MRGCVVVYGGGGVKVCGGVGGDVGVPSAWWCVTLTFFVHIFFFLACFASFACFAYVCVCVCVCVCVFDGSRVEGDVVGV